MTGAVIVAAAGDDAAAVIAKMRAAAEGAPFILLRIEPDLSPLTRAMLLAALGPLAAECAPAVRIGAIDVTNGADPRDVAAAADFLASARSTTGQVLTVAAEG